MGISDAERNRVLRAVQEAVPFVPEPFGQIAEEAAIAAEAVIELLRLWSAQGKLREISAILEGSALGYESALVAGAVDEGLLESVARIVSGHPMVTHNYLRNHSYNLWYTIAVPVETGLESTVDVLSELTGVVFRILRRTATFKIGVNFDLETLRNRTEAAPVLPVEPIKLTERDRDLFRALQTPLPIVERPFDALAASLGHDPEELLAFGRTHLGGAIRRYVGTLRHRELGVRANAMVVWNVPEGKIDELGARLAEAPEVSHCYARNAVEGFPYTLYSMLHGPDLAACEQVAARLSGRLGIPDYALLVSLREFKKTRLRYFLPELDDWWRARARP